MRVNLLIAALAVVVVFLQFRLWFQADGIRDMLRLKHSLAAQSVENDKLKQQNEMLVFQVERLKNSSDATESRARNELGMIKKDETFYQIVR